MSPLKLVLCRNDFSTGIFDFFCFQCVMETTRRTERPNKGVNSQLYQTTVDDEKQEREAQKYIWVFYKKGDANPFSLTYNSVYWPKEYANSREMKMGLIPGEKLKFKYNNEEFKASLSCRVNKFQVFAAEEAISSKVAQADTSLTDISYLP